MIVVLYYYKTFEFPIPRFLTGLLSLSNILFLFDYPHYPQGFRFCGMYYLSPKEVFQAFIKRAEEASMIKQPTSLGLGLAQQQQAQRKSRFSSAVQQQQQQQPPMPPMPMGGPMGAYPGQPGPYYGAGMGPMGGYPPAPPVGSSGAYGYSDYGYGGGGERRY